MNAPVAAALIAELRKHFGVADAITAPQLAALVGLNERDVRAAIAKEIARWEKSEWRNVGLLLSRPGAGFFFATEAEEVAHWHAAFVRDALNARQKLSQVQAAMKVAGFGGLIKTEAVKSFAEQSHPEKERTAQ